MIFSKQYSLHLMSEGNPYNTLNAIESMLLAKQEVVEHLQGLESFKNLIKQEGEDFSFSSNSLELNTETYNILLNYCKAVDEAKSSYIKSAIAFEYPVFSSDIKELELYREADEAMRYLSLGQYKTEEDVFNHITLDNGDSKIFLNIDEFFKEKYFFTNLSVTEKNKDLSKFHNINDNMSNILEKNPFRKLTNSLLEEVLGKKDNTGFLLDIKEEVQHCKYYIKIGKFFKKMSILQATKINKKLEELGEKYNMGFYISPAVAHRNKEKVSMQDYNVAVSIMDKSLEAPDLVYGLKNKKALPCNMSIVSISSRFENIYGYFLKQANSLISSNKLICIRGDDVSKTTLLHEISHSRDAMVNSVTIEKIISKITDYRKKIGLTPISKKSSFMSEEFMKEILVNNNGVYKYKSYIDAIEDPLYQDLVKSSKELFNLQMFGKKEISPTELDVSDNYKETIKQINKEVAKASFEELINSEKLTEHPFFKSIRSNSSLREKMFDLWEKNIIASGLSHVALANIKNGESNEIKFGDMFVKEKIGEKKEGEVTYLSTQKRTVKNEILTPERNFFINELKRVSETFIEDANKYVSLMVEHKDMSEELNKLLSTYIKGVSKIENVSSIILSKAFESPSIKDIAEKLDEKEIPTTIAFFKESDMIVTPINLKSTQMGIENIYKKEYSSTKIEFYTKSLRELFARNTENTYYALKNTLSINQEESKPKGIWKKFINAIYPKNIKDLINIKIADVIDTNAIQPDSISETVQMQIIETEEKITRGLMKFQHNDSHVEKYLEDNPDKLKELVNFGNEFNISREKMQIISKDSVEELAQMRKVFDKALSMEFRENIEITNVNEKSMSEVKSSSAERDIGEMINLINKNKQSSLSVISELSKKTEDHRKIYKLVS